jgi:hypothetical protein
MEAVGCVGGLIFTPETTLLQASPTVVRPQPQSEVVEARVLFLLVSFTVTQQGKVEESVPLRPCSPPSK